jgi:hypothetical protein
MPISHDMRLFSVSDAKVYELTADPVGGPATYGAAIDLPFIRAVGFDGDVTTAEMRGDNGKRMRESTYGGATLALEWGKLSLDATRMMLGSTVTDAGTTPNQTATLAHKTTDILKHWKFEAKVGKADIVGGGVKLVAFKCIVSGFPNFGFNNEEFSGQSVAAACEGRIADDKDWDLVGLETDVALPA